MHYTKMFIFDIYEILKKKCLHELCGMHTFVEISHLKEQGLRKKKVLIRAVTFINRLRPDRQKSND